jgi:hypothetical protein
MASGGEWCDGLGQHIDRRRLVGALVGDAGQVARLDEFDPQPVGCGEGPVVDLRPRHARLVVDVRGVGQQEVVHSLIHDDTPVALPEGRHVADVDEGPDRGIGHAEAEVVGVDRVRVPPFSTLGKRDEQVSLGFVSSEVHVADLSRARRSRQSHRSV